MLIECFSKETMHMTCLLSPPSIVDMSRSLDFDVISHTSALENVEI